MSEEIKTEKRMSALQITLRPGDRIEIGDDTFVMVSSKRSLSARTAVLRIEAPKETRIKLIKRSNCVASE